MLGNIELITWLCATEALVDRAGETIYALVWRNLGTIVVERADAVVREEREVVTVLVFAAEGEAFVNT